MDEEEYQKICKEVKDGNDKRYKLRDGLLYKKEKDKDLRVIRKYEYEGIMYLFHNHETAAHFGSKTTYEKIKA